MKKQNSLIFSGLFFLAALLAEVYCILAYREDLVIIAGVLLVVLISAYLLFDGIYSTYLSGRAEREKQAGEQYRAALEAFGKKLEEFERLQKALFASSKNQTRVLEEGFRSAKDMVREANGLVTENINQAAKMAAKYNRDDLKRVAAGNKKAADDMIKAFRESTSDIAERLPDLFSTTGSGDSRDIAVITECINRNFEGVKLKIEGGFELMEGNLSEIRDQLVEFRTQLRAPAITANLPERERAGHAPSNIDIQPNIEPGTVPDITDIDFEPEAIPDITDIDFEPEGAPDITDIDFEPEGAPDITDIDFEPEGAPDITDIDFEPEGAPDITDIDFEPEGAPDITDIDFEPETIPDITDMGSEPEASSDKEAAKPEPDPDTSNPNKQMSPDEIAALFAAAGSPEPDSDKKAPSPTPDDSDPNKQMSQDEIAALFATTAGSPEPTPDKQAPQPEHDRKASSPALSLDDSDPNKQMSPDEIAALFAAANAGEKMPEVEKNEPEPAPFDVGGDSNKQMSPDEIAALIASMGK